jgi:hypothetical protein
MQVTQMTQTSQRHADQFTDGTKVFEVVTSDKEIKVIVEAWNSNHNSFVIYYNGIKETASSNYPKAIGLAMLLLN